MLNSKDFSDYHYSKSVRNPNYGPSTLVSFNKVLEMIPSKGKVLDIGCFSGYLLEKIKEKNPHIDVFGVDASKESVRYYVEKGLNVIEVDAEGKLPFEDSFFNTVIGMEIIEHIVDTDSFLIEIKRILKKDGYLILTTPNVLSLSRRLMALFGVNPFFEASFSYPSSIIAGHVRFFSHILLKGFLEFHHFKVLECKSDVINFSNNQKLFSVFLADLFPKLGRGVLIKGQNIK
ncbi:MAG: class I SAM-dependent methyltransferase [Proteobacteria bacterium]|nr:class I SAM-dependent methyltransferase [Pseudomonadota bacterium]